MAFEYIDYLSEVEKIYFCPERILNVFLLEVLGLGSIKYVTLKF